MTRSREPLRPMSQGPILLPQLKRTPEEVEQAEREWEEKLIGKKLCEGPAPDNSVSIGSLLSYLGHLRSP